MKVGNDTMFLVEIRQVKRDAEGNPLPAGDWEYVWIECSRWTDVIREDFHDVVREVMVDNKAKLN